MAKQQIGTITPMWTSNTGAQTIGTPMPFAARSNLDVQQDKLYDDKKKKYLKINDTRKVDSVSGKEVKDTNNMSTLADPDIVRQIIVGAKKRGIDPNTAISIAMQETGVGKMTDYKNNPLHLNPPKGAPIFEEDTKNRIEESLDFLKEKMKQGKARGKTDEASILQAWNGYGKFQAMGDEDGNQSLYGIDLAKLPNKTLDMNENPVYGKRIIDLRDNVIKQHPEIQSMIKDIYGGDPIHATQDHIKEAMQKTGHTDPEVFQQWFNAEKGKVIVPITDDIN